MKTGLLAAIALLALCGCEAKTGNDAAPIPADSSAEGKAEKNRLSIRAPGFNLNVAIPEGIADNAEVDSDNDLIHPGSRISGIHIEGGDPKDTVEMRFTNPQSPAAIAAWYRDPARAGFMIESVSNDGAAIVLAGRRTDGDEPFKLRLDPALGGTDGRLLLEDRD
jgi:hypothetical protein